MRVLITTDTIGGVWTFTCELTQQLLERGHAVHLVSFGRLPSLDQQAWADEQSNAYAACFTFTPSSAPLEWMQDNEHSFEQGSAVLAEAAVSFNPDLLLSNQFCFGRMDTTVPRIVVAHSDVFSWAAACRSEGLPLTPWLTRYTSLVQAGISEAAAVVAPTAWMGKALTANFALPRHFLVIPNGVSVDGTGLPQSARKLQAITAGRLWDEAKGLETLGDLTATMPLLVAGDNSLSTAEHRAEWPMQLTQLGRLAASDLHQRFRESAIYLCTSRYEPFGLAPVEAALCGCAVVARDLPSLHEVWADNALYFDDAVSLQETLDTLAENSDRLMQAQSRAWQRATSFTPERMANSYLHLFETVLQQQAVPHVA